MHGAPSGIILVDKPSGPTSRRVVDAVERRLRPAGASRRRGGPRFRAGHAGTLDPLATGLLVVLVGRGTRLQPFLQGLDKRYLATVRLGAGTDSHDRDGEVTEQRPVPADTAALEKALEAALAAHRGSIMQAPPVISALKRDGRPLHRRVRRGEAVTPPEPRPVRIHRLELTARRWGIEPEPGDPGPLAPDGLVYELDLDIRCGSGTYVRSLARDLAAALGTVGHVAALRRTEVGPFGVEEAAGLDELGAGDGAAQLLRPLADALPHLPTLTLEAEEAAALRQGAQPDPDGFDGEAPPLFRLLDEQGELVAVGRRDEETGEPRTAAVFPAEQATIPGGGSGDSKDDPCA